MYKPIYQISEISCSLKLVSALKIPHQSGPGRINANFNHETGETLTLIELVCLEKTQLEFFRTFNKNKHQTESVVVVILKLLRKRSCSSVNYYIIQCDYPSSVCEQ